MPQDYNAADAKFVRDMIPHHEAAVEMASRYVKAGQDPEILQMANAIITGQRDEIARFRAWLSARDLDESPGAMLRSMLRM